MRGTQQNWNLVCKWGPYDNHNQPRTNPHPQGGLKLILGKVLPPQGHQQPPRTPVLKPSSDSTIPIAWITKPAMDSKLSLHALRKIICGIEDVCKVLIQQCFYILQTPLENRHFTTYRLPLHCTSTGCEEKNSPLVC